MAQCNAQHPLYRKVACRRLPNYCGSRFPHLGRVSKGQWVRWDDSDYLGIQTACRLPSETVHTSYLRTKSNGRCWYCGASFLNAKLTRDHVTPRSRGGLNVAGNLVLACEPCNCAKADMPLEVYRAELATQRQVERIVFYGENI